MTPQNLAKHQSSPHFEFWKNIKEGHDYFGVANHPRAGTCATGVTYSAATAANAAGSMAGACPAVSADPTIVSAFLAKQDADATALSTEITRLANAEQTRVAAAEQRERAAAEAAERGRAINEAVDGFFNTLFSPFGGGTQTAEAEAGV